MPCACTTCRLHARTLGAAQLLTTKSAIHKAYRAAAKLWHPDRYENNQRQRLEAEERFKRIQIAYRELCEHHEHPQRAARTAEPVVPAQQRRRIPTIFFGDTAPGCFSAPNFPGEVQKWIAATRLDSTEKPIAFINLFQGRSRITRYILLTDHKMYIRDATDILHVIWYSDLGEIMLTDLHSGKSLGAWQKLAQAIAGPSRHCSLRITKVNGDLFRELIEQPDDRIKKVVYNFLRQMRSETQA
jgi:hypothetical protein